MTDFEQTYDPQQQPVEREQEEGNHVEQQTESRNKTGEEGAVIAVPAAITVALGAVEQGDIVAAVVPDEGGQERATKVQVAGSCVLATADSSTVHCEGHEHIHGHDYDHDHQVSEGCGGTHAARLASSLHHYVVQRAAKKIRKQTE